MTDAEKIAKLREMLEKLQWSDQGYCPECRHHSDKTHREEECLDYMAARILRLPLPGDETGEEKK